MGRRATGQIIEHRTKDGDKTFAIRFPAYGKRQFVTLGAASEGWTKKRAQDELANVLADVRRGIWHPPAPDPVPDAEPTFHEFASDWFAEKRRELRPNTVAAYEYELTHHLLPFFKDHTVREITPREVDRYRAAKVRERENGARLGNETINKTIARLAQILEDAVEYELIDRNPAKGRRRRLKVDAPRRPHLDRAEHIEALLAAAGEHDRQARCDRGQGRRALLATLVFAGLRIGEALSLRWRDVDLASGRIHVGAAKTDAGVRDVDVLPALRDELATYKAQCPDTSPSALVFPTATGKPQGASNVRNRTLAKAIERADERLTEDGDTPLPEGLTPHALRRTFASILVALGRDANVVMEQMGHTDPKFTLKVYAQMMRRGEDERAALRRLVGEDEAVQTGTVSVVPDYAPRA